MSDVQVGDTVRLKSGGPIMTVIEVGELDDKTYQSAACAWFVADGEARFTTFPLGALIPV